MPTERRFACSEICNGGCQFITVDFKLPRAIKKTCIRDGVKVCLFEEVA